MRKKQYDYVEALTETTECFVTNGNHAAVKRILRKLVRDAVKASCDVYGMPDDRDARRIALGGVPSRERCVRSTALLYPCVRNTQTSKESRMVSRNEQGLVKVNFHGDELECVRDDLGVWVSLKRACENIGIDYSSQLAKLRGKHWAVVGQCPMTGNDGKLYEVVTISLDSLPMWLATIDAERVAEHVRPKIELYQRECAQALRDYWFTGAAVRQAPATIDVRGLTAKRLEAKERRLSAELLLKTLRVIDKKTPLDAGVFSATAAAAMETVAGKELPALKPKTSAVDWFTPTQIAEQLGVSANRIGMVVTDLGIRGNVDGLTRAVLNKAAHSDKTVRFRRCESLGTSDNDFTRTYRSTASRAVSS